MHGNFGGKPFISFHFYAEDEITMHGNIIFMHDNINSLIKMSFLCMVISSSSKKMKFSCHDLFMHGTFHAEIAFLISVPQ